MLNLVFMRRLVCGVAHAGIGLWLLSGFSARVEAKTEFAFFVNAVDGSTIEAQRTGAVLNWMMQQLTEHKKVTETGMVPLDRGMFFSRSRALGARRWLQKATARLNEGMSAYPAKPEEAVTQLQQAATFFDYTHPYYMERKQYQRVLILLSMLLYRRKQADSAWRNLSRGILLDPSKLPTNKLSPAERKVVEAARCKLAQINPSTLIVKTRRGARAVYLNGQLVGFGDQTITGLRAGEYYVSVREDGYRRWGRKRIRIAAGATKTLYARNMRGSQFNFHQDMCKQLLPMKEGEQLTDKLKDFAGIIGVKRLWVGCFKADASGKAGSMNWFYLQSLTTPGKLGSLPILSGFQTRFLLLARLTKALGFANPGRVPGGLMTYQRIPKQTSCPDLQALIKKITARTTRYIVLYTHYGFRLQGKLLGKTATEYTLEVSTKSTPPELKRVVVPVKMIRYKWEPGRQQYQGFRLGERVVVQTIYGLSTEGRLVSIDDTQVQLKTRQGDESIPRNMIKSVHKRDR